MDFCHLLLHHSHVGDVPCEHRNGDITGYSVKYGEMGSFNNGSVMNITGACVIEATISNLILSTM